MRRLVDDDVRTRLGKMDQRGLVRRTLYSIDELTSRKDSTDIPDVLDHLEVAFDPLSETRRKELQRKGHIKEMPKRPLDVLLATNMVSVGVDVQRLGLMVVGGQPKTTAEYHPYVKDAIKTIVRRAELVGNCDGDESFVANLKTELNERLNQWLAEAQKTVGGRVLGYDEERDGITVGLLDRPGLEPWDDFTCLNSLRDVEPNVGLILHDGGLDADPEFAGEARDDEEEDADEEEAE